MRLSSSGILLGAAFLLLALPTDCQEDPVTPSAPTTPAITPAALPVPVQGARMFAIATAGEKFTAVFKEHNINFGVREHE